MWDASLLLSTYIASRLGGSGVLGKNVLELGAGVGLVGIVCSLLGATVSMTDKDFVLPLTRSNAWLNAPGPSSRGSLRVERLEWGQRLSKRRREHRQDLILASDVLGCGDEALYPPLIKTLLQLCDADTEVLMSYKPRARFEKNFFATARAHFSISREYSGLIPYHELMESYSAPIDILKFRLRNSDTDSEGAELSEAFWDDMYRARLSVPE